MKLSDPIYSILKWIGLILMPALATLIGVLGKTWGLPNTDAIVTTINALGVFLGALIGISSRNYYSGTDERDGGMGG